MQQLESTVDLMGFEPMSETYPLKFLHAQPLFTVSTDPWWCGSSIGALYTSIISVSGLPVYPPYLHEVYFNSKALLPVQSTNELNPQVGAVLSCYGYRTSIELYCLRAIFKLFTHDNCMLIQLQMPRRDLSSPYHFIRLLPVLHQALPFTLQCQGVLHL